MTVYNLAFAFNEDLSKILTMKRDKKPFIGLINGLGGKVMENETIDQSLDREFSEESGYLKHQHTPFKIIETKIDGDNIIHVGGTRASGMPEAIGENLDIAWTLTQELLFGEPELFAPEVQQHIVDLYKELSIELERERESTVAQLLTNREREALGVERPEVERIDDKNISLQQEDIGMEV